LADSQYGNPPKINPQTVAHFSHPKNDRQFASFSPAFHHKFTTRKPRSTTRFLPKPPQKQTNPLARKNPAKKNALKKV
jgi:hypothetical protein